MGYSPWQEGTYGLRPFTGWEQEQKDLLATAFLGVQSWAISGGSLPPLWQILGTLRQKGGATAAPHCTCAKVEDLSDLSSSCRVSSGRKGRRVP